MKPGMNSDEFLKSMISLRREKSEFFNSGAEESVNFVLCTHVLPDGIGDLVHLKDFADAVASIPNAQVTRIAFVLETEMEKAASILEIGKSRDYYLIPYKVGEQGALVVTDKGQELLSTLQQTGILENSDFRIQISAPLQIVDKNLFLKANGFFTPQDWLSFFEIRPGVSAYQTKSYAQGLVYMGLEKNNKETGIKLNETISRLSEELNTSKTSKTAISDQKIKNPVIKKVVSQAVKENGFIATGYVHSQVTKQAYLAWMSTISEPKNILITTNNLNPGVLNEMDVSSLVESGIGQIVFYDSDGNESIFKIGEGKRKIDVLQMKECTNEEINALFAIADTTCAAGDTSIGQVMSSPALPFFDVVDNKRYFLDTQLLKFIQELGDHQPLHDYLEACMHLVTEEEINQEKLQKMIAISTEQRPILLRQWERVTAKIREDFNAYEGLFNFIEENTSYQFFARATQVLFKDPERSEAANFLKKYQDDFFDYLIYTGKTELLIKLLENGSFAHDTVLHAFHEKNIGIFKLILNAGDERFLASILHNLDQTKHGAFLSKLFMYCAQNGVDNEWIKNKYADRVDCRALDAFSFDLTMEIDADYIVALCKKALEDNDEDYFKKLSQETLFNLHRILPEDLVPPGIEAILKEATADEYFSEKYDSDSEEMVYPPESSDTVPLRLKEETLGILLNLPVSDEDKQELILLLEQPAEVIRHEVFSWLNGTFYEQQLHQQIAHILTRFAEEIQPQKSDEPIPQTYSSHTSFLFFGTHSLPNRSSMPVFLEKEKVLKAIQTLSISPPDKVYLSQLLDEPKEAILAEAEMWQNHQSFYDKNIEKQIARLLNDYAIQLEDEIEIKKPNA